MSVGGILPGADGAFRGRGLGAPPGGLGQRCGSMMHNQSRIMMTN